MENAIYNELCRRGFSVDVGTVYSYEKDADGRQVRKNLEVDFVANLGDAEAVKKLVKDVEEKFEKIGCVEHPIAAATERALIAPAPFLRIKSIEAFIISVLVIFTLGGIASSKISFVIYHLLFYHGWRGLSRGF